MVKTVEFMGKQIEVTDIDVVHSIEHWNEAQLADGKVIMFKDVITSAEKVVSEKTPDGEPLYLFHTHRVVRVK